MLRSAGGERTTHSSRTQKMDTRSQVAEFASCSPAEAAACLGLHPCSHANTLQFERALARVQRGLRILAMGLAAPLGYRCSTAPLA